MSAHEDTPGRWALLRWPRMGHPASILPRQGTTGRALGLVMSIMSFLACLTVWASVSITFATDAWTAGLAKSATVQLKPGPEGPVSEAEVTAVATLLHAAPGLSNVRVIPPEENAALLEPWIGTGSLLSELPLPVLIEMTIEDREAFDLEKLQSDLRTVSLNAVVDDHTRWTNRLFRAARSLTVVTLSVLALVLIAAMAIIVFATRASLQTHAAIVEILHVSGARAGFIAREFQSHFLSLGLRSGLIGLGLALLVIALTWAGSRTEGTGPADIGFLPRMQLTSFGFAMLLLVPVASATIGALTARSTVLSALRKMP